MNVFRHIITEDRVTNIRLKQTVWPAIVKDSVDGKLAGKAPTVQILKISPMGKFQLNELLPSLCKELTHKYFPEKNANSAIPQSSQVG